jgi:hypothetical protein
MAEILPDFDSIYPLPTSLPTNLPSADIDPRFMDLSEDFIDQSDDMLKELTAFERPSSSLSGSKPVALKVILEPDLIINGFDSPDPILSSDCGVYDLVCRE